MFELCTSLRRDRWLGAANAYLVRFSTLVFPQIDATEEAAFVGDDLYVFWGQEIDLLGVAAA